MKRLTNSWILRAVLSIALLSGTTAFVGCTPHQLSQTAEAAKDIGGGVKDTVKAVAEAYHQGLITLAQKDKLADLLAQIARGGDKGVDAIEALQRAGVTNPNANQRAVLNHLFDDAVIAPFLQLLTELGKLSPDSSIAIRTALAAVRTAILLFSQKVGRNDIPELIRGREVQYV